MNTNKLKMKKWIKKDCIKEGMNKWINEPKERLLNNLLQ